MRWHLFLCRMSFITGVFFLLSASLMLFDWIHEETAKSTIIIIGYFLGLLFIPLANLVNLVLLVKKGRKSIPTPNWLFVANFIFLLLLTLFIILYLNDSHYSQA